MNRLHSFKKPKQNSVDQPEQRILVFQIFLCVFMALIIVRLFFIAVGQHSYYLALAANQQQFQQQLMPTRGQIFITDKTGASYPVATNTELNMVSVVTQQVKDPQAVANTLGSVLNLDSKDLLAKITDPSRHYVVVQHGLTDQQSAAISSAKLAGVELDPEQVRYYPEGNFMSQVLGFLGYTNSDNTTKTGLYGLEKSFNTQLAGTPGWISTATDSRGNWITGSKRDFVPKVDGSSLVLTIDRSIQYKAESVLADAVQKHGADSGTVIVANPKTGAILAMATYPSFDPNQYSQVPSPSVYLNGATMLNYEPGSTMKTITLSSALDQGLITPDTTFDDTGHVKIGGFDIQNSDHKGHGIVSMTQVIDHSLNTGAIWVEQQLGDQKFEDYLKKFGFGQATALPLQQAVGNMNNVLTGGTIANYTASFGQGIAVTPIQMLQAYFPVANKGVMMKPYIVAASISPDGNISKTQPQEIGQIISPNAAAEMTQMLVDDVDNGYGKAAAVKGYSVAGKTGTAQVASTTGGYVANDNIGSFIGFAPASNPQFVMLLNINHPRDVNFAETTAVPAFGQIANFILNYYQIPPDRQ